MSASLELDGVKEMIAGLRALPDQLTREELGPIVRTTVDSLAADVKGQYAKVEGVLADRVTVEISEASPLRGKVRSRAPHAHLYEYGTVRRSTNDTGANRGTMPARPVFVPTAIRWRGRMMREVKRALERMRIPGFTGRAEVRES